MSKFGNPFLKREKVFARPKGVSLDRNAKIRIIHAAKAYNTRHKRPGQHWGPLTRTTLAVLEALLWGFHNSRCGDCFPSYESIAAKANCCRDSVHQAIKALEEATLLTWVNCFTKIRSESVIGRAWQVIRTSNFYLFRDPLPCAPTKEIFKSENPPRTLNPDISHIPARIVVLDTSNSLDAALARLGRSAGFIPEKEQVE